MDAAESDPTDAAVPEPVAAEPGAPTAAELGAPTAAEPYRALARKYRPTSFDDLIGQGAMVRTLRNAFATGRIAQAYMLTGVRGVGKTTTARILARALNYETDAVDRPSIDFEDGEGVHDRAILEGRHPDVIEMDAASHTGVDNMRDILAGVQYAPTSARMKVYIIDEVHMLSSGAFNAMLKTLEEPPAHVRFIFATTEIRKVPVTVLSRCQRFDLRRVPADALIGNLRAIAEAEGAQVEDDALAAIARASEGSVRDAQSLLDQAIARGIGENEGAVTAETVRDMLGLADRGRVIDLFDAVMRGDVAAALEEFGGQYGAGAAPAMVLTDLAAHAHLVSRLKLVPSAAEDASLAPEERERGRAQAEGLSVGQLSRAWQMLLRGIAEVEASPRADRAAEMVLIRLAHAADLPGPGEALAMLRDGAGATGGGAPHGGGSGGASAGGARASAGATNAVGGATLGSGGDTGGGRVVAFARDGGAARRLRPPDDALLDPVAGAAAEAAPEVGRAEPDPSPTPAREPPRLAVVGGTDGTDGATDARARDDAPPTQSPATLGPAGADDGARPGTAESTSPDPAPLDAGLLDAGLLDPSTVMTALYGLAVERNDIALRTALRRSLRLVSLDAADPAQPVLTLASDIAVSRRFAVDLAAKLGEWTGTRWAVAMGEGGGPTLSEREDAAREARLDEAALDPDVAAVLAAFPGARVTDVRPRVAPDPADDVPLDPDAFDPDATDDPDDPDDDPIEEDAP